MQCNESHSRQEASFPSHATRSSKSAHSPRSKNAHIKVRPSAAFYNAETLFVLSQNDCDPYENASELEQHSYKQFEDTSLEDYWPAAVDASVTDGQFNSYEYVPHHSVEKERAKTAGTRTESPKSKSSAREKSAQQRSQSSPGKRRAGSPRAKSSPGRRPPRRSGGRRKRGYRPKSSPTRRSPSPPQYAFGHHSTTRAISPSQQRPPPPDGNYTKTGLEDFGSEVHFEASELPDYAKIYNVHNQPLVLNRAAMAKRVKTKQVEEKKALTSELVALKSEFSVALNTIQVEIQRFRHVQETHSPERFPSSSLAESCDATAHMQGLSLTSNSEQAQHPSDFRPNGGAVVDGANQRVRINDSLSQPQSYQSPATNLPSRTHIQRRPTPYAKTEISNRQSTPPPSEIIAVEEESISEDEVTEVPETDSRHSSPLPSILQRNRASTLKVVKFEAADTSTSVAVWKEQSDAPSDAGRKSPIRQEVSDSIRLKARPSDELVGDSMSLSNYYFELSAHMEKAEVVVRQRAASISDAIEKFNSSQKALEEEEYLSSDDESDKEEPKEQKREQKSENEVTVEEIKEIEELFTPNDSTVVLESSLIGNENSLEPSVEPSLIDVDADDSLYVGTDLLEDSILEEHPPLSVVGSQKLCKEHSMVNEDDDNLMSLSVTESIASDTEKPNMMGFKNLKVNIEHKHDTDSNSSSRLQTPMLASTPKWASHRDVNDNSDEPKRIATPVYDLAEFQSESEKQAISRIQNLIRRRIFNRRREKNNPKSGLSWIREVIVMGNVSETDNYFMLCEALQICLTTKNDSMAKKTLSRVSELNKTVPNCNLLDSIPCELLLKVLHAFVSVQRIAGLGLELLTFLCNSTVSVHSRDDVICAGAMSFVYRSLKRYVSDPKSTFEAMKLMSNLVKNNVLGKSSFLELNVFKIIMLVAKRHKFHHAVMESCFHLVCMACEGHDGNIGSACSNNVCSMVLDALAAGDKTDREVISVLTACSVLLSNGVHVDKVQQQMGRDDISCSVFVRCLSKYYSKTKINIKLCSVITALVSNNEMVKSGFIQASMCDTLMTILSSSSIFSSPKWRIYTLILVPVFFTDLPPAYSDFTDKIKEVLQSIANAPKNAEEKDIALKTIKKLTEKKKLTNMKKVAKATLCLSLLLKRYLKRLRHLREQETLFLSNLSIMESRLDASYCLNVEEEDNIIDALDVSTRLKSIELARLITRVLFQVAPMFIRESFLPIELLAPFFKTFTFRDVIFAECFLDLWESLVVLMVPGKWKSCEFLMSISNHNWKEFITKLVEAYGHNSTLMLKATRCVYLSLFQNRSVCDEFSERFWCALLCDLMRKYKDSANILENCLILVVYMCVDDNVTAQNVLGGCGICPLVIEILDNKPVNAHNKRLINAAGRCIVKLASNHTNNKTRFVEKSHYCDILIWALSEKWKTSDQMLLCIVILSESHDLAKQQFATAGLLEFFLSILKEKTRTVLHLNRIAWAMATLYKGNTVASIHRQICGCLQDFEKSHPDELFRVAASVAIKAIYGDYCSEEAKNLSLLYVPSDQSSPLHGELLDVDGTPLSSPSTSAKRSPVKQNSLKDQNLNKAKEVISHLLARQLVEHDEVLTPNSAARRIQWAYGQYLRIKLKREHAENVSAVSWSREAALIRLIVNSDDRDVIMEALQVGLSNSNIDLSRKALVSLRAYLENHCVDSHLFSEIIVLLIDFHVSDTDIIDTGFGVLRLIIKQQESCNAVEQMKVVSYMMTFGTLDIIAAALTRFSGEILLCFEGFKLMMLLSNINPACIREFCRTGENIKFIVQNLSIHQKHFNIVECIVQIAVNAFQGDLTLQNECGTLGMCDELLNLLFVHQKHPRLVNILCNALSSICTPCCFNQKLLSTSSNCEKWIAILTTFSLNETFENEFASVLENIFCVMGGRRNQDGNKENEEDDGLDAFVEIRPKSKIAFIKSGLLKTLNIVLADGCLPPSLTIRVLKFCRKVLAGTTKTDNFLHFGALLESILSLKKTGDKALQKKASSCLKKILKPA